MGVDIVDAERRRWLSSLVAVLHFFCRGVQTTTTTADHRPGQVGDLLTQLLLYFRGLAEGSLAAAAPVRHQDLN